MLWPRPRAALRRRSISSLLAVIIAWTLLEAFRVRHHLLLAAQDYQAQAIPSKQVRIYITSIHWNNEDILRESWNKAIVALAEAFGPSNVYAHIMESGSWDGSKAALHELGKSLDALGVGKEITLTNTTHADEIAHPPAEPGNGWIRTPRGKIELRRIPYLARLRNAALQHLRGLAKNGVTFDYVLFLNDVHFTVPDVVTLLNTNDGFYAAACALDFSNPPEYYDTFALRDADGHEHAMMTWPYFRSSESRTALKWSQPAPVLSCWNGMVIMPTRAFYDDRPHRLLMFRGIDDTLAEKHLEGSECCLIHDDNLESEERGVYLNPNVRVGYNSAAYRAVHPPGSWVSYWEIWLGLWKNRLYRWFTTPMFKEWVRRRHLRAWEHDHPDLSEEGSFCLVNEMQVLVENGWAHV